MKIFQIKIEFSDRDVIRMNFLNKPTKGELIDKLEEGLRSGDRYYETLYTAAINLINKEKKMKDFIYGFGREIQIEDRTGSKVAKISIEEMEVEENRGA